MEKDCLDQEILREIASVGGGYGQQLERTISRMLRISKAYGYLIKRIERSPKIQPLTVRTALSLRREFYRLREKAMEKRRNLIIYREAIGLLKHREVFEHYNIEGIKLDGESS